MGDRRFCPECGVYVKLENLPGHYDKQHPRLEVPEPLTEEVARASRPRPPATLSTRRERRRYLAAAIIVLIVVLAAVLLQFVQWPRPGTDIGIPSDCGPFRLSDHRGQVVLLDFMSTSCSHCQAFTRDTLVPLHGQYGSRFVLFSIDVNRENNNTADGNARIARFKTDYGATWCYALDVDHAIAQSYGVGGTPTHFVIDKDGRIVDQHAGEESLGTVVARLSQYW